MQHLITGGSGFIGNYMVQYLAATGEPVRVVDIWQDPALPRSVEFVKCDILNRDGIAAAMQGVDVVHHMAALVSVTRSSAQRFTEVNVIGSKIVAEEAVRAGVNCFVNMSSSSIFGVPGKCPVTAETTPQPLDSYAKSKLEGELVSMEIIKDAGRRFISVRPRSVIGEGRGGIFHILFDWIQKGVDIYTIGSGNNRIQFTHAADLVSACLALYKSGQTGMFNVGTDRYGTVKEALQSLINHARSSSKIKSLPVVPAIAVLTLLDKMNLSPLAPLHYLAYGRDYYCDLSPLKALGWKAQYSNEEMLCEAYDSFLANRDLCSNLEAASAHRRPTRQKLLALLKHLPSL